jgi:ABC-type sugar transport system ATPase subunit
MRSCPVGENRTASFHNGGDRYYVSDSLLETLDLNKTYGPTVAAQDIRLALQAGRVHALVGENGAGKSTVIKMITGLVHPTSGRVRWQGRELDIHSPAEARFLGIVAVHQELTLVDTMTIAQNIWLGHEPFGRLGTIDYREMVRASMKLIQSMGLSLDPSLMVGKLGISDKQLVEILKALSLDPKLLILDEATSTLDDKEVEVLLRIVKTLRAENRAVLFVSHRMKEIFQFCEYCSIMKDGKVVFEDDTVNMNEQLVITKMTGREISQGFPPKNVDQGTPRTLLSVEKLATKGGLHEITFQLRSGEILGIGGLQGHGQTELIESLFGLKTITRGFVEIEGEKTFLRSANDALRAGIALVPEDRKTEGLFIDRTVEENIIACSFRDCTRMGVISPSRVRALVQTVVRKMDVKAPSLRESVRRLSGGNQQKVAVGRWLTTRFKILLLIEPTRGIDVGTKFEIYGLLRELVRAGVGIIISTNEMIELVGLCDRVLVMFEKGISTELAGDRISEHNILAASFGHGRAADDESA